MSVRAYRVIKKELADCSFSLSHDIEIMDFLRKDAGFFEASGDFGMGKIEVPADRLNELLANYPWSKDDYRKKAIIADIAWETKTSKIISDTNAFDYEKHSTTPVHKSRSRQR